MMQLLTALTVVLAKAYGPHTLRIGPVRTFFEGYFLTVLAFTLGTAIESLVRGEGLSDVLWIFVEPIGHISFILCSLGGMYALYIRTRFLERSWTDLRILLRRSGFKEVVSPDNLSTTFEKDIFKVVATRDTSSGRYLVKYYEFGRVVSEDNLAR